MGRLFRRPARDVDPQASEVGAGRHAGEPRPEDPCAPQVGGKHRAGAPHDRPLQRRPHTAAPEGAYRQERPTPPTGTVPALGRQS